MSTNFHQFILREREQLGKVNREILRADKTGAFTETPSQMVSRACRDLVGKKGIIVINDEAHHCYRHKQDGDLEAELLKGDDRKEAEKREEAARVWISGLEAIKKKLGVKVVYDLSATPFFLRGSGIYPEGKLFPWVVSDFSLIDAIECGIVKIPRVPVADNAIVRGPTNALLANLRFESRITFRRRGGGRRKLLGIRNFQESWKVQYRVCTKTTRSLSSSGNRPPAKSMPSAAPPVFIVVANNTNVSKLIFDYIAGYDKALPSGETVAVPGKLPLFSNVDHGEWRTRPYTILVDSEQLESGDAMSVDFKSAAVREIEEFKEEYKQRFPWSRCGKAHR